MSTRFSLLAAAALRASVLVASAANAQSGQVLFSENFDSFAAGSCLQGNGWSHQFGCVAITPSPHPGWSGGGINGALSNNAPEGLSGGAAQAFLQAAAPITGRVEVSFRAWAPQTTNGGYVALVSADDNVAVYLQAWSNSTRSAAWWLQGTQGFTGSPPSPIFGTWVSEPNFMQAVDLRAKAVIDYDARLFWAEFDTGTMKVATPKFAFVSTNPFAKVQVYEDDRVSLGLDIDDLTVAAVPEPSSGALLMAGMLGLLGLKRPQRWR
jgi:hypothetical protein